MRTLKFTSFFVVVAVFITACISQPSIPSEPTKSHGNPIGGYVELVDTLRAAGAIVDPVGDLDQPFFSVTGSIINVNGTDIQTFEYSDEEAREAESSQIGEDGSFATTMVMWVDQPNFWAKGRMIVLYVGQDAALKSLLDEVMGPAIIEGEIPTEIIKPSSGNQTSYPARFRECRSLEPEISAKLRLAYVSDGDIWIWDEGLEPISLTGSGDIKDVMLTPSGDVAVFTRETETGTVTLWAVSTDGSGLRSLTTNAVLTGSVQLLSFSIDDSQLAFTHLLSDKSGEIWVANLDASGALRLVSSEDLMAIVAEPEAVGAVPTGVTWIPNTPVLTYASYPIFAQDGIYIYVQDRVWYVSTYDGLKAERFGPGESGHVAYSPDGTMMILTTPDSLRLMNIEAADLHNLGVEYNQVGFGEYYAEPPFTWTADSQAILMALLNKGQDAFDQGAQITIWRVPVDGSPAESLMEVKGFFPTFVFSLEKDKVSFWSWTAPQSNTRELHILALDGSEHIMYDSGDLLEFHGWSPNDQQFIYGYWEQKQAYVGDLCGEPILLDVFPINLRWIDGSRFIFERHDEEGSRLEVHLGNSDGTSNLKLNLERGSWYDYRLQREE